MNLFRTLTPTSGTVDVEAGTELKVGGLTNLANVNLNGTGTLAKLTINNHATASNSDVVNLNLVGDSSIGEVNVGTNSTLSPTNLNVAPNATLTKSGPGVLRPTGTLVNGGTITVAAGKLTVNGIGSGSGSIAVQSGGAIGGSGSIAGTVNVATGGSVSPHDGTTLATTTFELLNMWVTPMC